MEKIIGGCDYGVALCFLQDAFTMFSGKSMGAVSVFMIGSSANLEDVDGVSFLLEVVVATVAFFVVVLHLTFLGAMFSFHKLLSS